MRTWQLRAVLLAVACAVLTGGAARAGWLNSHYFRQEITVDPGLAASNLTGFPLLVKIDNPANDVFAKASSPGGLDIVFTAADGQTILPREIEYFSSGSTKELYAWVKADVSSTTPTKLYMYYRGADQANSTATWDSNFKMVQHLEESSAAVNSRRDSTDNGNDGTPYYWVKGPPATDTPVDLHTPSGRIDGADEFVGTGGGTATASNRVQVPNSASLSSTTSGLTVEAWIRPDVSQVSELVAKGPASQGGTTPYELFQLNGSFYNRVNYAGDTSYDIISTAGLTIGDWNYIVATYDSALGTGNLKLYINGIEKKQLDVAGNKLLDTNLSPVVMGAYGSGPYPLDGIMDEVRISDIARDADWLAATFANVNNAGLIAFGEAQVVPEPSSLALLFSGLIALLFVLRRRAGRG